MADFPPELVRKVAHLSRLKMSDEEIDCISAQLGDILTYVESLNEIDTDDVAPMAHAIELSNVFRSDEARESLDRPEALRNAPSSDGKYFIVPPILDEA